MVVDPFVLQPVAQCVHTGGKSPDSGAASRKWRFLECFASEMPGGAGGQEPVSGGYLEAAEVWMDEKGIIFKDGGLSFRTGCPYEQLCKK